MQKRVAEKDVSINLVLSEVLFSMNPHVRLSVGWSVDRSVCHNFFHALGAIVE